MRYATLLAIPLILFANACKKDEAPDTIHDPETQLQLDGHWDLVEAKRNNRVTGVLEDLYFVFHENGDFETNLVGNAGMGSYTYEGGSEIITAGLPKPLTFQILEHSDETLVLKSVIQGFDFEFSMELGNKEES